MNPDVTTENQQTMPPDYRLYAAKPGYKPLIKRDDAPLNCHRANPEDGFYHRIAAGEIYLNYDVENYCLNCALKLGILVHERPMLRDRPRAE